MPLTDTAIKKAKPEAKQRKLYDERGLFLLISPKGNFSITRGRGTFADNIGQGRDGLFSHPKAVSEVFPE